MYQHSIGMMYAIALIVLLNNGRSPYFLLMELHGGMMGSHTHRADDTPKPDLVCSCLMVNKIEDMLRASKMKNQPFEILRCTSCGRTLATKQNGDIIL